MIHDLINAVTREGRVAWYLHPLSLFGMYSYSYAAGIPLLLSAIVQLTGFTSEETIFLFCIFEGILAFFLGFNLAGEFRSNALFRLMVGAAISLAPGMLYWTTFTISTRGPFIVLLPMFIIFLMRMKKRSPMLNAVFASIVFSALALIHNMFVLLIPIIVAYLIGNASNHFASRLPKVNKWLFVLIIGCLAFLFLLPFSGLINELLREYLPGSIKRSTLTELLETVLSVARHYGVLAIFSLIGIILVSMKNRFNVQIRFLLITLAFFAPVFYITDYVVTAFLPLIMIFAAEGIMKLYSSVRNFKLKIAVIAIVFIIATSFSGTFQIWRPAISGEITKSGGGGTFNVIYSSEPVYNTGIYMKYETSNTSLTVNPNNVERIAAYSERPRMPCHSFSMLSYGIYTEDFARKNTTALKYNDAGFWQGNLYVESVFGRPDYLNNWAIGGPLTGNQYLNRAVEKYDARYVLIEKGPIKAALGKDVQAKRYKIYDNDEQMLYWLL